jgi:hypothetical protein
MMMVVPMLANANSEFHIATLQYKKNGSSRIMGHLLVSHLNWLSALPSYEGRAVVEGVK